jgi:hypothetical protein
LIKYLLTKNLDPTIKTEFKEYFSSNCKIQVSGIFRFFFFSVRLLVLPSFARRLPLYDTPNTPRSLQAAGPPLFEQLTYIMALGLSTSLARIERSPLISTLILTLANSYPTVLHIQLPTLIYGEQSCVLSLRLGNCVLGLVILFTSSHELMQL